MHISSHITLERIWHHLPVRSGSQPTLATQGCVLNSCIATQSLELGETGPDEATKGIESLQSSASQDLAPAAPQLQVSPGVLALWCSDASGALGGCEGAFTTCS